MRHAVLTMLFGMAVLGWATGTYAQGTITDGDASFVRGASPFDASPDADFTGVSSTLTQDHLFETGWWYRVSGDTQESVFPVPDTQSYVGDDSQMNWNDVNARGLFKAKEDTSVFDKDGPSGFVHMTMTITNLSTTTALNIELFHYVDFDVQPTAGNDSATLRVHPNHIRITDPGGNSAEYKGANAKAFLVRAFPVLRDALSNATVINFNNEGLPFGPGDFTAGFQWSATIAANGSRSFTAILAVNQRMAEGDFNFDGKTDLVTGAGAGGGPHVRVLSGADLSELKGFYAYSEGFMGGVHVATGDINGDGRADIITGAGPGGGPHVRVVNGANLSELFGFMAYDPAFTGGVFVAAGDVNADGVPDIITGPGAGGGPHVRVFSGVNFSELFGFMAYDPAFTGGVRVAAGDVNGDGYADIITGAGPGGGPHVRVFSGALFLDSGGNTEIASFYAYDPAFAGGVFVAAGDVDGNASVDIITGAGAGGGPHVRVFNFTGLTEQSGFFAFTQGFSGGVRVGAGDVNGDGTTDLVVGAGPGGGPHVRVLRGDLTELWSFYAYAQGFGGGVFVE